MFSKPKSNEIKKASDVSTNEKVDTDLTETNYNIEKNIVKDTENSPLLLLSTDLFIKGNLTTSGDIQIEGEVEGNIRASLLTVGPKCKN